MELISHFLLVFQVKVTMKQVSDRPFDIRIDPLISCAGHHLQASPNARRAETWKETVQEASGGKFHLDSFEADGV